MPSSNTEIQPGLSNAELTRRIEELQVALLRKETAAGALEDSEKRYRRLFESAKDGILILDAESGKVVDVNPFLCHLLGYTYDALFGQFIWDLGVFRDIAVSREAFQALQDQEYIRYEDLPLETLHGQPVAVEFVSNVYLVDGSKVIQCNIRDITARKRNDAERKRLMSAIEQVREVVVMTDARGVIQFVNPAFERATGYTRDEVIGQNSSILKSGKQDAAFYQNLWGTISAGQTWVGVLVNRRKDGALFTEEASISPVRDPLGVIVNYVAVKRDISEHLRLTAEVQQAQKMESVGLLAGGVAHDFNNMLSVILGYTELAMHKVDPGQALHNDLEGIRKAAVRSADITRQLLAFARKQTIIPVVMDLNGNVESMLKMLRRLIGENIDLSWLPAPSVSPIRMDPVQVGQILANLCVNARDAIADVGKITIETRNASFDEADCVRHPGLKAGDYVLLSVTDDGCGMDKAVQDQIFDPFYTSKEAGQGTGLGLSMVYGIVKQNNGFISVYSEPGKGASFQIYLPRHTGDVVDVPREPPTEIPQGQGETVLLVEDEPALLSVAQLILERFGYRVLAASSPTEALVLAREHASEIQLLITDIIMPDMNGRDLSDRLQALYPDMKTLFMSGYTSNVVINRGVLDKGVNFVQKPFSMKDLAVKVRNAISGK